MSARDLKSKAWKWAKHYLYGLLVKSWNSSIKSVDAFMGVAVGAAVNPDQIQAPNWTMAAYIFGTVYVRSVVSYFAENPIPVSLADDEELPPGTAGVAHPVVVVGGGGGAGGTAGDPRAGATTIIS